MDLPDSGARKQFASGAVRDVSEGKGRCDLLCLEQVSKLFDDDYVLEQIDLYMRTKYVDHLERAIRAFVQKEYKNCMPTAIMELSKHFESGALKYEPSNWGKGIPIHCYIDSAIRHYLKYLRGDDDEPHNRAVLWNLICGWWTAVNKPEMMDLVTVYDV